LPAITANSDVGTLSKPSKMPGPAWGIPAKDCITGSKLRSIDGTACSKCYACKGRYLIPNVAKSYQHRLDRWRHNPDWVEQMAIKIAQAVKADDPYFRWFDSGDLQSRRMLQDIVDVCELLPHVNFWLPTQERRIVRMFGALPDNLVVRVSATHINGYRPHVYDNASVILPRIYKAIWALRVARSTKTRYFCPAPVHDRYECGDCRACWDPTVKTVAYLER